MRIPRLSAVYPANFRKVPASTCYRADEHPAVFRVTEEPISGMDMENRRSILVPARGWPPFGRTKRVGALQTEPPPPSDNCAFVTSPSARRSRHGFREEALRAACIGLAPLDRDGLRRSADPMNEARRGAAIPETAPEELYIDRGAVGLSAV